MNKEIITNSFEQRVDGQDRFKLSISGLGPTLVFSKFSITFGSAAMRFTFLSEEEEISDFKLSYSDFFIALDDAQQAADAAALKKRKIVSSAGPKIMSAEVYKSREAGEP